MTRASERGGASGGSPGAGGRAAPAPAAGHLVNRIVSFARLLRSAGIAVGPGGVIDGVRAIEAVGVNRRSDFYWALHAVFVRGPDEHILFDEAFRRFWRETGLRQEALAGMAAGARGRAPSPPAPASRRAREGLRVPAEPPPPDGTEEGLEPECVGYSPREVLRRKDFEQMSTEEVEAARRAIEQLVLPIRERPVRRLRPAPRGGTVDMRRSFRAAIQAGGGAIPLRFQAPARRRPPLVALLDISGSMGAYTRILLHFLYALVRREARIEAFLFGTRLSRVTRHLRGHDVDAAFARIGEAVRDWGGGTRIGGCLGAFNRHWARRVLGQGAVVLLVTDGLEREEGPALGEEVARLRRSCRRLIWLNPLLRYDAFQPKALGIRAILPCVDDFRPVHNLESLEELARALSGDRRPTVLAPGRSGSPRTRRLS